MSTRADHMPQTPARRLPAGARGRVARRSLPLARSALAVLPLVVLYVAYCALAQPGSLPVRDEPDLVAAAARLVHGHLVPQGPAATPRAFLWHGPGYVTVLAPFVGLGTPLTLLRFLGPALLGAAVLLFHAGLRTRMAPRRALAWTYALGLYVPFLAVLEQLQKEPLAIGLVVAGILALARGLEGGRLPWLLAAGACLAALTMVRLEYGWVIVALLVVALVRWLVLPRGAQARRLVVVAATGLALCGPWLAYTHHLTGRTMYWGTSSGISLYWMSPTTAGETGQWHGPSDVVLRPELAGFRPVFSEIQTMDPVRSDLTLRHLAAENIRARPLAYARNLVVNTGRLLAGAPMRPQHAAAQILLDAAFALGAVGAFAWALLVARRRRLPLPPETLPVAVFAVAAVLVHIPASASPRMLLPVVPALVWVVAQVSEARRRPEEPAA